MKGCLMSIGALFLLMAAMCAFYLGCNALNANEWNNGVCSNCNVNYELRGVSSALKYYVCPSCHDEISRF